MKKLKGGIQMLIFQCRRGDIVKLGKKVDVVIINNRKDVTCIGIEAPKAMKVTKSEVRKRETQNESYSPIAETD